MTRANGKGLGGVGLGSMGLVIERHAQWAGLPLPLPQAGAPPRMGP